VHQCGWVCFIFLLSKVWKSKSRKCVTLSSTEAENYSSYEIANDVIFSKILLEEIVIQIMFPINIKCDNVGAIYLKKFTEKVNVPTILILANILFPNGYKNTFSILLLHLLWTALLIFLQGILLRKNLSCQIG
jgi:hypothetical protein